MKVTKLLLLLRSDVNKGLFFFFFFFTILTLSSSIKEPERSPLNALQLFLGGGEILWNLLHPVVQSRRPRGHPTSVAHQLNPLSLSLIPQALYALPPMFPY